MNHSKPPAGYLITGIFSIIISALVFMIGIWNNMEASSIKESGNLIVIAGNEAMSVSEYLDYAKKITNTCNALGCLFLLLALIFFLAYNVKKKKHKAEMAA